MKRVDQRQFVTEVSFLNKRNEFNYTFKESLMAGITFQSINDALLEKKDSYNYAYTNLFKQYKIVPEDLYDTLDKTWDKIPLVEWIKQLRDRFVDSDNLRYAAIFRFISNPTIIISIPITAQILFMHAVSSKWAEYKIQCLAYAEKHSLKESKKETK